MSTKEKLETAHKLILQSAAGPCNALEKGKASAAELTESLSKLKQAQAIIEGILK